MDNTATATTWTVSSKYPHPDTHNTAQEHTAQVRRIYAMTDELRRRDLDAYAAAREFAKTHIDDLDAIEITLRQTLETLDAADERMTETEMRMG